MINEVETKKRRTQVNRVQITEDAKYSGQDMAWTETLSIAGKTAEKGYGIHFSDYEIEEFLAKETCFFMRPGRKALEVAKERGEYVYLLEIPKGTFVEIYDSEIRVNLTPEMVITDITGELEHPCDWIEIEGVGLKY